jgi:GcrA cell cycle regulator
MSNMPPIRVYYTAAQKAAIIADYHAGMPMKDIKAKHGCDHCTPARLCRRAGLPVRATGKASNSWPAERTEELKRLWGKGVSAAQIARHLHLTKGAVIGKVHRLKLTDRAGKPKPTAVAKPDGPPVKPVPLKPSPVRKECGPPKHLTLFELTAKTCRWPLGDSPFTFCGNPTASDGPYCRCHSAVAYREPPPRRKAA